MGAQCVHALRTATEPGSVRRGGGCRSGVEGGVCDAFADPVACAVLAPSEGIGCEGELLEPEVVVDDLGSDLVGDVLLKVPGFSDLGHDRDEGLEVAGVRRVEELGGTGGGGCCI